jgi:hypothetical protein
MTELTILKNGALPSTAFSGAELPQTRLDDGIGASFARISYKGSKWNVVNQQKIEPVMALMGGTKVQSPFLDVVILKAANHPTKAWFADAYQEGDSKQPDCFSNDGLKPDPMSLKKQNEICLDCPRNAWGSRINRETGEASRGKACSDSKKLAIVPVGDIENKIYGGPMLLQVPPSSLKRLGPYQNVLAANGFHYAQVYTRITFDNEAAYPLFVFDALQALDDVQAEQVVRMLKHPLVEQILSSNVRFDDGGGEGPAQPSASVHTLRAPAKPAKPAAPAPVQAPDDLAIPDHLKAQALTPEQQKIADLEAQLAAAKAPKAPEPPKLTPEQQKIKDLEDQLAAAKAGAAPAPARVGRPRGPRTPAVAPTNMDSQKAADTELPGAGNPPPDDAISRINATLNKAKELI